MCQGDQLFMALTCNSAKQQQPSRGILVNVYVKKVLDKRINKNKTIKILAK